MNRGCEKMLRTLGGEEVNGEVRRDGHGVAHMGRVQWSLIRANGGCRREKIVQAAACPRVAHQSVLLLVLCIEQINLVHHIDWAPFQRLLEQVASALQLRAAEARGELCEVR